MLKWPLLAVLAAMTPAHLAAQVRVDTAVFLEKRIGGGDRPIQISQPERFIGGDTIVTILRWNAPGSGRYTLTSAVPKGLSLRSASRDGLTFSIDGGRSWRRADNVRNLPYGITHLRWQAGPGEGRLSYRSVVL